LYFCTDKCNLNTVTATSHKFGEKFLSSLKKLKVHDFVAHQQSSFLKETKFSLQDREVIVLGDFLENYSFGIQDAAQGFHSNNQQVTIHALLSYFKNFKNKLENLCFSESLYHDTVTVYNFQKHSIAFFKENISNILKIYYFSYGASAQYKSKNSFIRLCHHNFDFGINAECHFFATSHDKGPSDGAGGTIKCLADCSSLRHHQLLTPAQLYSWAKEHLPSIHVQYICNSEAEQI
jgi:hypothetical protein